MKLLANVAAKYIQTLGTLLKTLILKLYMNEGMMMI